MPYQTNTALQQEYTEFTYNVLVFIRIFQTIKNNTTNDLSDMSARIIHSFKNMPVLIGDTAETLAIMCGGGGYHRTGRPTPQNRGVGDVFY